MKGEESNTDPTLIDGMSLKFICSEVIKVIKMKRGANQTKCLLKTCSLLVLYLETAVIRGESFYKIFHVVFDDLEALKGRFEGYPRLEKLVRELRLRLFTLKV